MRTQSEAQLSSRSPETEVHDAQLWDGVLRLSRAPGASDKRDALKFDCTKLPGFSERRRIFFWFHKVMIEHHANGASPNTIVSHIAKFRPLPVFLEEMFLRGISIGGPEDFSSHFAGQYQEWVRKRINGSELPRRTWNTFCVFVAGVREIAPDIIPVDLILPAWISRKKSQKESPELTESDRVKFREVCRREIDKFRDNWARAAALIADAEARGFTGHFRGNYPKKHMHDAGVVLLWMRCNLLHPQRKFGEKGTPSEGYGRGFLAQTMANNKVWKLLKTPSNRDAWNLIAPTARDLLPFIWLIADETAMNTSPVLELETDCLESSGQEMAEFQVAKHLNKGRQRLKWTKKRARDSNGNHEVQGDWFDVDSPYGPIQLVRSVLEITKSFRDLAPPGMKKYLFITESYISGFSNIGVSWFHNLLSERAEELGCPTLQLRALRKRAISYEYERGGSLAAKRKGKQKSDKTIRNHYIDTSIKRSNQDRIAKAVLGFESKIADYANGKFDENLEVPAVDDKSPAAEMARVYIKAFGNPNNHIVTRVRRIAFMIQFRDHLLSKRPRINPLRWERLYAVACAGISKALALTDPKILAEAKQAPRAPIPIVVE